MYKKEIQTHNFRNTRLFAYYKSKEKKVLVKREYYRPDNDTLWREDIYSDESSYYNYIEGWDLKNDEERPKLEKLMVFKTIIYYSSAKINSVWDYQKDLFISYHENGQIKRKYFFKRFHTTKMNGAHSQVGKIDGKQYEYYKSGVIKIINNYEEGCKNGIQEYFDKDGRKIREENFEANNIVNNKI